MAKVIFILVLAAVAPALIRMECEQSPLYGSSTGRDYKDNPDSPCNLPVVGMKIRHGEILDSLQMKYRTSSGSLVLGNVGGGDGGTLVNVDLSYGEIVRQITGMNCTNQEHYTGAYVRQLIFTTETASGETKLYGPYGAKTASFEQASCEVFAIAGNVKSVFGKIVASSTGTTSGNLGAIGAYVLK